MNDAKLLIFHNVRVLDMLHVFFIDTSARYNPTFICISIPYVLTVCTALLQSCQWISCHCYANMENVNACADYMYVGTDEVWIRHVCYIFRVDFIYILDVVHLAKWDGIPNERLIFYKIHVNQEMIGWRNVIFRNNRPHDFHIFAQIMPTVRIFYTTDWTCFVLFISKLFMYWEWDTKLLLILFDHGLSICWNENWCFMPRFDTWEIRENCSKIVINVIII